MRGHRRRRHRGRNRPHLHRHGNRHRRPHTKVRCGGTESHHPYWHDLHHKKERSKKVRSCDMTARNRMKASRQTEGRRTAVRCISASCCIRLDPASSWAAATASCIHHHTTPNYSVATLRMSCCSCGCSRSPDVSARWGGVLRSSGDCAMAGSSPETAWPGLKPIAEALFRANRRSLADGVPNAGLVRAKTCRAPVCSHQTADVHPRGFRSYGLSSHYSADEGRCGLLATACCAPFHLQIGR